MQTATKTETDNRPDMPQAETGGQQAEKRAARPNRRAARYRDLSMPRYEEVPGIDEEDGGVQNEISHHANPVPARQETASQPAPPPQGAAAARRESRSVPAPQENIRAVPAPSAPRPAAAPAPTAQDKPAEPLSSVWAQLGGEMQSCGNKNNIKEDINDFAILATRIREEKSGFTANIQEGAKMQTVFDEAVHKFAEVYANRTGLMYEQAGRAGMIAKICRSVEAGIYERIQQCLFVKKYALQVEEAMRRDVVKSALDKLPWPQAREGLISVPELYAADRLLAEMKTYERQFGTVIVKNEELLGFEIGLITLKAQVLFGYLPNLADTLRQILSQRVDAVLDKVDAALEAQPRLSESDAAGSAPLDRSAIEAVGAIILQEFGDTGSVHAAVLRTAQYAQQVFEDKKDKAAYGKLYRYHLVDDFWEGLYVAPSVSEEDRKKQPLSDVSEDWNQFVLRTGIRKDNLLIDKVAFDAEVLAALQPYSPAARGVLCGIAALGWVVVLVLLFVLPRVLGMGGDGLWWIPLIPQAVSAVFVLMMWRTRGKRKRPFRVWTALFSGGICLELAAQAVLIAFQL